MTLAKIETKKIGEEREKNKKIKERIDKDQDYFASKEAKNKLKEIQKEKELEYIRIEKEKSLRKQKEMEEKKERLRIEKLEKRRNFLESVAVAKRIQVEEDIRLKKEFGYEQAQEILGLKYISQYYTNLQKMNLKKAGIFN